MQEAVFVRSVRRSSHAGGRRKREVAGRAAAALVAVATLLLFFASAPRSAQAHGDGANGVCRRPMAPGLHSIDVVQEGVHRPFQLWIPAGYKGKPIPLLFWLHGSGTTGESAMATADPQGRPIFPDHADAEGYAVATPSGAIPFNPAPGISGFAWNIPGVPLVGTTIYPPASTLDDIAYIGLVIDAVAETICLDERRVYASGASGGGRMASQLACDSADRIAAIAPVMGLRAPRLSDTPGQTVECEPSRPVPVVTIHGRLDPVNVFADDDPRIVPGSSWTYGLPEALERWAHLNDCRIDAPLRKPFTANIDRVAYRGCRAGANVELYDVADGGHTVPGTAIVPFLVPLIGPTNQELHTPSAIWSFVSRHRLRGNGH
ncbi:MAG: feruloyl esterase [Myxococcota bacterium]